MILRMSNNIAKKPISFLNNILYYFTKPGSENYERLHFYNIKNKLGGVLDSIYKDPELPIAVFNKKTVVSLENDELNSFTKQIQIGEERKLTRIVGDPNGPMFMVLDEANNVYICSIENEEPILRIGSKTTIVLHFSALNNTAIIITTSTDMNSIIEVFYSIYDSRKMFVIPSKVIIKEEGKNYSDFQTNNELLVYKVDNDITMTTIDEEGEYSENSYLKFTTRSNNYRYAINGKWFVVCSIGESGATVTKYTTVDIKDKMNTVETTKEVNNTVISLDDNNYGKVDSVILDGDNVFLMFDSMYIYFVDLNSNQLTRDYGLDSKQ